MESKVRSYQDTQGTNFADLLERACLSVTNAKYFYERQAEGKVFMDRENIPEERVIQGKAVIQKWGVYGAMFLTIVSYAWLSKEHPDPDRFHLPRLVRVLTEIKAYATDYKGFPASEDLGVILDYCALW